MIGKYSWVLVPYSALILTTCEYCTLLELRVSSQILTAMNNKISISCDMVAA
jgi:hypothetical protein